MKRKPYETFKKAPESKKADGQVFRYREQILARIDFG